ncbi:MAG: NUDIX domain-containing protein [Deltaproteobacteria bacterium]|nr:NUDIX domain-containing protein [Deltaproteobacteria bacterium]
MSSSRFGADTNLGSGSTLSSSSSSSSSRSGSISGAHSGAKPTEPNRAPPSAIGVEIIQNLSSVSSPLDGFLRRYRLRAKTLLSDGSRTETYLMDYIDRAPGRRDAVAVALVALDDSPSNPVAHAKVLLRKQARYPVHLVTGEILCTEVVAGIIEGDEAPEIAVVREVLEETSLEIDRTDVTSLGPAVFASPGMLTERFFPMMANIPTQALDHLPRLRPAGDGSPMEEGAVLLVATLEQALDATLQPVETNEGTLHITDAKTEIVLNRVWRHLTRLS